MPKKVKPRLIMLQGLPASGKSTRAEELVVLEKDFIRVNKDKIREMCRLIARGQSGNERYTYEWLYEKIEIESACAALREGLNVVVDDTNLKEYHVELWKKVAYGEGATFEIESFLDVDVEECVKRDAARKDGVGKGVIYKLAASIGKFPSLNKKIEYNGDYGIVDMDGTLANLDHRLHHIKGGNADWTSFFSDMDKDLPNDHVVGILKDSYPELPWVVCTGRPEPYRKVCEDWLDKHVRSQGIKTIGLLMREEGDKRPDDIVKGEMLRDLMEINKVRIVIDDRKCVLQMWNASGLRTINVGGANNEF